MLPEPEPPVPHYLVIHHHEDYTFLVDLVRRSVARADSGDRRYTFELAHQLKRVLADLEAASTEPVPIHLIPPDEPSPPPKPKRLATPSFEPHLCPEHPKYAAKRAPRTPCRHCWDAYARLNPTRADHARAKFRRKSRST